MNRKEDSRSDERDLQIKIRMALSASPSTRVKIHVEGHMLELARDHAVRAKESRGAPYEMRETIGAIVMSAACLESFVNGELVELGAPEAALWDRLEEKWHKATGHLGSPIEKGKEPFQSLHWLVKMRNYVIHFVPRFEEPIRKGQTIVSPVEEMLTADAAKRAVTVAANLLEDYASRKRLEGPWHGYTSPTL